jgi:hypothetical protein
MGSDHLKLFVLRARTARTPARRQAGGRARLRTRTARSATRRSWRVQEFSNKIGGGIDDALDLSGNTTALRREARPRGRRGGQETCRRMAVRGAAEPIRRLDGATQGGVGADDRGGRRSRGPGEKTFWSRSVRRHRRR